MRSTEGFDIWASGYDASVLESDTADKYPFAGYRLLMNCIFDIITAQSRAKILDVGIGTGFLSSKLYNAGCEVWGVDLSEEMLRIARDKMPSARIFKADFSSPLPREITDERFDYIISTYALHHLTAAQKIEFIERSLPLAASGGKIIIGDVSFSTRLDYEKCREAAGASFDDDEFYWVADELLPEISNVKYVQLSHCAGVYIFTENTQLKGLLS
jgi:putative AdoMet-dependent methyltransferase